VNIEINAKRVAGAIEELAAGYKQTAGLKWRFIVENGKPSAIDARLDGEWLVLDSVSVRYRLKRPTVYLAANGLLPGLGKAVASRGERHVRLRAEIPVDGDVGLLRLLCRTCSGLAAFPLLIDRLRKGGARGEAEPSAKRQAQVPGTTPAPSVGELLKDTGWRFKERAHGALHVDLEAPEADVGAVVCRRDDETVCLRADLGRFAELKPKARDAMGLMLLTAAASIRFARPVMENADGAWKVSYEVGLHETPSTCELDHALRALSTAARTCAKEVVALSNERIAGNYLCLSGWNRARHR
jgi:hypothetical protein